MNVIVHLAGKIATLTRVAGGQKTVISWQDAPDDLFYRAGAKTKKVKLYSRFKSDILSILTMINACIL